MWYSQEKYRPHMTLVGEFNGAKAYEAANRKICPYPPFITVPETVTGEGKLTIASTFEDIVVYPELFFVLGRDVACHEGKNVHDAILGYGVSLGINERSLVNEARRKGGMPRDITACGWYQLYMDGTHIIGNQLVEAKDIEDVAACKLTIGIPGYPQREFDMAHIIWRPQKLLKEMSELIPFRKHDKVYLGPVDAPVKLNRPLTDNAVITVKSNKYFEDLCVAVENK